MRERAGHGPASSASQKGPPLSPLPPAHNIHSFLLPEAKAPPPHISLRKLKGIRPHGVCTRPTGCAGARAGGSLSEGWTLEKGREGQQRAGQLRGGQKESWERVPMSLGGVGVGGGPRALDLLRRA